MENTQVTPGAYNYPTASPIGQGQGQPNAKPNPVYVKPKNDANTVIAGLSIGIVAAIVCFICVCCCLPLLLVLILVVFAEGDGANELPPSSEELRDGDDFVGVLFAVDPGNAARNAFSSAAQRWSEIVDGTTLSGVQVAQGEDPCDLLPFSDSFFLDHLMIISNVKSDDGPGGILASAGPCAFDASLSFPIVGLMNFDSDDIEGLQADGTFETVILHEMGHVLGIGSLWFFSEQGRLELEVFLPAGERLLQNPIFDLESGNVNNFNVPEFVGNNGVAQFANIGGSGNVPVEDGRGSNAQGAGSIDSHWKITVFDNELMVFAIDSTNSEFPLSVVTIGSLQDLGYTVDITQADAFTLPLATNAKKATVDESKVHYLQNDIIRFPMPKIGV